MTANMTLDFPLPHTHTEHNTETYSGISLSQGRLKP
jgi:hypothetical protein